jgi:hypothetical protein
LLILLLLLVALFIFAALVGSRGGLSAGGCLPTKAGDRKRLSEKWFKPTPLGPTEIKLQGCALSGRTLIVNPSCVIVVPESEPAPDGVWEKIRAAFKKQTRRLALKATTASVKIKFKRAEDPKDRDPVEATLEGGKETDFAISRAGATLFLVCPTGCQVVLPKPSEEP